MTTTTTTTLTPVQYNRNNRAIAKLETRLEREEAYVNPKGGKVQIMSGKRKGEYRNVHGDAKSLEMAQETVKHRRKKMNARPKVIKAIKADLEARIALRDAQAYDPEQVEELEALMAKLTQLKLKMKPVEEVIAA